MNHKGFFLLFFFLLQMIISIPIDSRVSPCPVMASVGTEPLIWNTCPVFPGVTPTTSPRVYQFENGGPSYFVLGTDKGIAVIALNGSYICGYFARKSVIDIELGGDIDQDGMFDLVIVLDTQEGANAVAISSHNGSVLWRFTPTTQVINSRTYLMDEFITQSWDAQFVNDVDGDGIRDVAIASWHSLYLLSGSSGQQIWKNDRDFTSEIWVVNVINLGGVSTRPMFVAGSREGKVAAFDTRTGTLIWSFTVPKTTFAYSTFGDLWESVDFPNSIDDILILQDLDADGVKDFIVSADDGSIRLVSGLTGTILTSLKVYSIEIPTPANPLRRSLDAVPYDLDQRIFEQFGVKLLPLGVLGSGTEKYIAVVKGIDLFFGGTYKNISSIIFEINSGSSFSISIIANKNWRHESENIDSLPIILNLPSGENRLFINSWVDPYKSVQSNIYYFNGSSLSGLNCNVPLNLFRFPHIFDYYPPDQSGHYLVSVEDQSGDGVTELFAFDREGYFGVFDSITGNPLWYNRAEAGIENTIQIRNSTGSQPNYLLFTKMIDFRPQWKEWVWDNREGTILSDVVMLDENTGHVIWRLSLSQSELYDGVIQLKDVGDITGDNFPDFAAWSMPTRIPSQIMDYLRTLDSTITDPSIEFTDCEEIYRVLLANYTRFLGINGATGAIFWDSPLFNSTYSFFRNTTYGDSYANPSNQKPGIHKFSNLVPGRMPKSWYLTYPSVYYNYSILWRNTWNWDTLRHPTDFKVAPENAYEGSIQNLWAGNEGKNLTVQAIKDGSQWATIINFTIPTNLSSLKQLGSCDYPLAESERVSAVKLQTAITLNQTTGSEIFSYSLYNYTSAMWVTCNWTGARTWGDNYPMLYGNFSQPVDGGYRSGFANFAFLAGTYRNDTSYVIMRGSADADPAVEFDFENRTTLSDFIDSNGFLRIQMNVTTSSAFNVSLDAIGAVVFYWGLFNPSFDNYYVFDYDLYGGEGAFTRIHTLDLKVRDFEVINGTGDGCLDLLVITSGGSYDVTPLKIGLSMFDLKNRKIFTKWSLNSTVLPTGTVGILPVNNSLNMWILSGSFFGNRKHKFVFDPHWELQASQLANYSDQRCRIEYVWSLDAGSPAELPGLINYTSDGDVGIITGTYDVSYSLTSLIIRDLNSKDIIFTLPAQGLIPVKNDAGQSQDFSEMGSGFQIVLRIADFNGDGILDHEVLYEDQISYDLFNQTIRIYDGDSGAGLPKILFEVSYLNCGVSLDDQKYLGPRLVPVSDFSGDGIPDGFIGFESYPTEYDCKESMLDCIDIFHSGITSPIHISGYPWIIDKRICTQTISSPLHYNYFVSLSPIEDVTGDGFLDCFSSHNAFRRNQIGLYEGHIVTDLLDLNERKLLVRVDAESSNTYLIDDVNSDGTREIITALTGGAIICSTSNYSVLFNGISNGTTLTSPSISLQWQNTGKATNFAVFVDDLQYFSTAESSITLDLGEGMKLIRVVMQDSSGLIESYSEISVIVPPASSPYFIVIPLCIVMVVLIGIYISRSRSYARSVLIRKGGKMSSLEVLQSLEENAQRESEVVICSDKLTKIYPKTSITQPVTAINGIDLRVQTGIHGLLGPNGAGKTTTINIIVGAISPSSGAFKIWGLPGNSSEAKRVVGFLPQEPRFPGILTGEEYLIYLARLHGFDKQSARRRAQELLDYFDLFDARNRAIQTYSGGMRQKLGIAASLIHSPKLLILDEPTANMDAPGRAKLISIVKELARFMTVFISSHVLSEVEEMCDSVTVINHGQIIASDSLSALKEKYASNVYEVHTTDDERLFTLIRASPALSRVWMDTKDNVLRIIPLPETSPESLYDMVWKNTVENGLKLYAFQRPKASLTQVFIEMLELDEKFRVQKKSQEGV